MTAKMKGAAMVIAALEQEKVDTVFGYPGGAVLPFTINFFIRASAIF